MSWIKLSFVTFFVFLFLSIMPTFNTGLEATVSAGKDEQTSQVADYGRHYRNYWYGRGYYPNYGRGYYYNAYPSYYYNYTYPGYYGNYYMYPGQGYYYYNGPYYRYNYGQYNAYPSIWLNWGY